MQVVVPEQGAVDDLLCDVEQAVAKLPVAAVDDGERCLSVKGPLPLTSGRKAFMRSQPLTPKTLSNGVSMTSRRGQGVRYSARSRM